MSKMGVYSSANPALEDARALKRKMDFHIPRFTIFLLFVPFCLLACTANQVREISPVPVSIHPDLKQQPSAIEQCLDSGAVLSKVKGNTVFIHPGLYVPLPNSDRAIKSARRIVDKGLAARVLEIRKRDTETIYNSMISESGDYYIGLHYSIGAAPNVMRASLDAARLASVHKNEEITYGALLVEPYNFISMMDKIDLDDPHLEQVIVVLSTRNSFFRPRISEAPKQLLQHPKFHYFYAEDLGIEWNHFSFLTNVKDKSATNPEVLRTKQVFDAISFALAAKLSGQQIENILASYSINNSGSDTTKKDICGQGAN